MFIHVLQEYDGYLRDSGDGPITSEYCFVHI